MTSTHSSRSTVASLLIVAAMVIYPGGSTLAIFAVATLVFVSLEADRALARARSRAN